MTDKIDDGGPAFPSEGEGHGNPKYHSPGMSLRDHFAGQALPTVLGLIGIPEDGPDDLWDGSIAERCYALADAMLAARKASS